MVSASVHKVSAAGYGSGKSELYDKVRHQYQPKQMSRMFSALHKKDGLNVAEMAAGTGLLTRALLADPHWSKAISALKCTEPLESMRGVFTRTVHDPRVSISEGTFEKSDLPDAWADVIVVATAFHWCNDVEATSQEFNRILKPEGTIILIWQQEDLDVRWSGKLFALAQSYQTSTGKTLGDFRTWPFRKLFDLPSYKANFLEPEEDTVKYSTEETLETVIMRFMTWSAVAVKTDEEKRKIAEHMKEIVEKGEDVVWVNKAEGILDAPMSTPLIVIRRK